MRTLHSYRACCLGLVLAGALGSAGAAKPEWAGQGKDKKHHEAETAPTLRVEIGFGVQQQQVAREYFGAQQRAGKCPPGLAKKNNGCKPPGQVKQWHKGQALPAGVTFYPLPKELVVRMGLPPAGHQYVRVASDILLIAVGTRMVVDAMEDLMR